MITDPTYSLLLDADSYKFSHSAAYPTGLRRMLSYVEDREGAKVLGPEDGSVSSEFMRRAKHVVSIPTCNCLNVAAAGTVVMYDRATKGVP